MKITSRQTIEVYLLDAEICYEFRIPSHDEVIQLREEYEILDFVLDRPPFFDWVAQRLIFSIDNHRADSFEFDFMDSGDAQSIRFGVREMMAGLMIGKCCVCGCKTEAASVVVCPVCTEDGWESPASIDNFRTELGISRIVQSSRWALRDGTVSYMSATGTICTMQTHDIDVRLRGFTPPEL